MMRTRPRDRRVRAFAAPVAGVILIAAACAGGLPFGTGLPPAPEMDPERIARDVAWLAHDDRAGRGAGSPGLDAAAAYLATGFREAGLTPGGDAGSYFQHFSMPVSISVARALLRIPAGALERGADYDALFASDDGDFEADAVFAGYGISSEAGGYDDYAGIDVIGKVALVLDDRPEVPDTPAAVHAGSPYLRRTQKIANARRHGARAILIVSAGAPGDADGSTHHLAANPATASAGVVALGVTREVAAQIVAAAGGASLDERQAAIDSSGQPRSGLLKGVRVGVDVQIERRVGRAANVIGVLPGSDLALRHESLVIGAHYDHLGVGPFGSLAREGADAVHNGADDNASGAAGLLELARAFAALGPGRRTLVFAAFAGEEIGVLGSREYTLHPTTALSETIGMINLDMIGRLREGKLSVFGTDTSPDFPALVRAASRGIPVDPILAEGAFAPSDQSSFYAREVPVIFFFTGTHPEYHTPDDDAALVNARGESEVLRVVYRTAREMLDAFERPAFRASAPPAPSEAGGSHGPYLGTLPDFAGSPGDGVRLQGVRPDSPAARAGLRAGDRILSFDGASVRNLAEFSALLFTSRAGDDVAIVVLRGDERIETLATLADRR